ncbi:MAG: DNA-directed RNA polymerase subunit alpha C-terminal domain-containing protein, partial [Pirellulales bacterium]
MYAERYAAAATLYEMATGTLPKWGDGTTEPSHLSDGTEITIDSEMFDASLREPLADFFKKALRRSIGERFHNAEEMLRAWRKLFEGIEEPGKLSDDVGEAGLRELLSVATFDTQVAELGLGTRATNALDRANILTVEDLLTASMRRLLRLRGVGNKTRRQISTAVKMLRERLGKPSREAALDGDEAEAQAESIDVATLSVDLLLDRALKAGSRESETGQKALRALLGLDFQSNDGWPNQADVARFLNISRARVGQILGKLQAKWAKDSAISHFRTHIIETLDVHGGVMSISELASAMLIARGSAQDEPRRSQTAAAAVRAAIEAEQGTMEPRIVLRRGGDRFLVARDSDLAAYGLRLGDQADRMADEDPLVAPNRVIERLREVPAPEGIALSDARLLRLAAAASRHSVISGRQELYPCRMPAARALRLSQGAVMG